MAVGDGRHFVSFGVQRQRGVAHRGQGEADGDGLLGLTAGAGHLDQRAALDELHRHEEHAAVDVDCHVHAEPAGDVRFPDGIDERFVKTDACRFPADRENDHDYTFAVYHKVLPEPGYVNLDNARKPEQWAVMERILLDGVCPFCPQHLAVYHKVTVIRENAYWVLTKNQWPYENTRIHLLIIAKRHWQTLSDIRPAAWVELGEMVASVESEHLITGGGLGLRCLTHQLRINHLAEQVNAHLVNHLLTIGRLWIQPLRDH